jgi:hypothetical protein
MHAQRFMIFMKKRDIFMKSWKVRRKRERKEKQTRHERERSREDSRRIAQRCTDRARKPRPRIDACTSVLHVSLAVRYLQFLRGVI